MSSPTVRRACSTMQRRAMRTLPKYSRSASSHTHDEHHGHHDHHEQPHPWTYPKETLTSRPFILTSAAFVLLLGLHQAGIFDVEDGKNPITRFMADRIASKESILEENLDRIEVVKEEAADYRLRMSAKLETFRPVKTPGLISLGSPHGLAVKPRQDVSEIKGRVPRDE